MTPKEKLAERFLALLDKSDIDEKRGEELSKMLDYIFNVEKSEDIFSFIMNEVDEVGEGDS